MFEGVPFQTRLLLSRHDGPHRLEDRWIDPENDSDKPVAAFGGEWEVRLTTRERIWHARFRLASGVAQNVAGGVAWTDTEWREDNYVLLPGAVYAGNRFHSQPYAYAPPIVGPNPKDSDRTPWIGDLPRLSRENPISHLDQMSIDCATPGMGIYFPARRKALFILTPQQNKWGPYGLEILEDNSRSLAEIRLMSPGFRHDRYFSISGGFCLPSQDRGADLRPADQLELDFHFHWFDCDSPQGLFDFLFDHREDCFDSTPLRKEIPFSAVWDILHEKHNRENWREELNLYQVSILNDPPGPAMLFQSGWTGGMITPYAMIQEGDDRSLERALLNIGMFLPDAMGKAGLFHEFFYEGVWGSQFTSSRDHQGRNRHAADPDKPWTLARRIGDVLYFLTRSFDLLEEKGLGHRVLPEWRRRIELNAEAICSVWRRHGEIGQYLNVDTGEVEVAGSTAGALVPAALVLASRWLKRPEWIPVAVEIGDVFRTGDLASCVTTGGPGDCVQAPDSESVAALIESFILLHEETGDPKWVQAARDATVQTASWSLSYDYEFPEGSALAEIGAQSRGSFLANAQNKTGVPGICTLSGQGILRLFRATGDTRFLALLRDIAHTIPQYMGREDKAIPTRLEWGRRGVDILPAGWICERVNVTQWGEKIGEISAYSCWCEVAMMLTWCDIPGVYAQPDTGILVCMDHVEAEWASPGRIRLHNPTSFPARVKLMVETATEARGFLAINFAANLPEVSIGPGASRLIGHGATSTGHTS